MSTNASKSRDRAAGPVSLPTLGRMKQDGEKIACLTAYDASFAARLDEAGMDVVLVGDTLGMVVQGRDSTVPVSVEEMAYHSTMVARGLQRAFLMTDMPFLSYATRDLAVRNAARLMQEGGAKMVKLEGGALQAELVAFLTSRGIPVCAHIGLQPQFVHKLGGYKVQGREDAAAEGMLDDARALCEAGADMLLLECVPTDLARRVTEMSPVPVIGIGAGPAVDGQILVLYDMLDITVGRKPRFVRNFMQEAGGVAGALRAYVGAVRDGSFPAPEHCF
ncbi:MAG TPA: 3-methyl-2-oxobutanoate hydroxymethyltransferase [Gammaproteobacteria bacterium]|nr:3-methyl-2-oxobutanoate hydroxymethyltransferase [Gammaproteobacteria bacterium]